VRKIAVEIPEATDTHCVLCRSKKKASVYGYRCDYFRDAKGKQIVLTSDWNEKNPKRCPQCLAAEIKEEA